MGIVRLLVELLILIAYLRRLRVSDAELLVSYFFWLVSFRWFMPTDKAGDRICIFGFSRGAYIARGLAGMIHKVRLLVTYWSCLFLLRRCGLNIVLGWSASCLQLSTSSFRLQDVHSDRWSGLATIQCVQEGIFSRCSNRIPWSMVCFKTSLLLDVVLYGWLEYTRDTVNSVGLIPRRLPFTTSNTIVRTFRHALSLDERRAKFKANLWNRPNTVEAKLGVEGQKPQKPNNPKPNGHSKFRQPNLRAMEKKYSGSSGKPTDIEEVSIHFHLRYTYRILRTFNNN